MSFTLCGFPQYELKVITPFCGSVGLGDFHLEKFCLCHVGSQPGERLTPASSHAHQQGVATWLLQDAGNAAHVFDGKTEEHQIHGRFADVVILVQVGLHHLPELVEVMHLTVVAVLTLGVVKVAEHKAAQVILSDLSIMVLVQVLEELMEVFLHVTLRHQLYMAYKPGPICVVNQSIIVNPQDLRINTRKKVRVRVRGR